VLFGLPEEDTRVTVRRQRSPASAASAAGAVPAETSSLGFGCTEAAAEVGTSGTRTGSSASKNPPGTTPSGTST